MCRILYNFLIWCYYRIAISFAAFFNRKAADCISGRKKLINSLSEQMMPFSDDYVVWFHVASVGEFEQARPLIEKMKAEHGDWRIVLTFFSPSGYNMHRKYALADVVSYLPMDLYRNVRKFLDVVHPDMAIFVKYEFWYNYLTALKRRGIPTYLVSAIFRGDQWFFRRGGGFMRKMLRCFNILFVQNRESVELLKSIGIENAVIAGDTRFDRVDALRAANSAPNRVVETFRQDKKLWIVGSSWGQDEELIASVMPVVRDNGAKLVIVPHEVHDSRIEFVEGLFREYKTLRYTHCSDIASCTDKLSAAEVLIVDCIGILSKIYKYASFAYIGGGFNRSGIHNILEPATYGCPVLFGPNYSKFQEAKDLIAAGGAFSVARTQELEPVVADWLGNDKSLKNISSISSSFVKKNLGAAEKILKYIKTEK